MTTATTTTTKVHLQVFVWWGDTRAVRNVCNMLRGAVAPPVVGAAPIHGPGSTGEVTCPRCKAKLIDLGLALEHLIPLRPDVVAAQERAAATRRLAWQRPEFTRQVQAVADDLRRKADEVERELARYAAAPTTTAVMVASQVQHTVLWMLANLSLDGLTARAAELDQLAQEAK